jgi:2-haloacid dehalogenase
MIKAFAFDLFGTLVDNASISKIFREIGVKLDDPKLFSEIWHSKQIQYALVTNSIDREFEPFNQLSLRALKFTTKICRLQLSVEQIDKVNEGKLNLDPFPDSKKGLEELKAKVDRVIVAILSNGETSKTDKLLSNGGLRQYFDYILSAEDVKKYKPSREPYIMASKRLGIPISDICLVSSNLWDIAGGQAAGMQTCWINRGEEVKANEELDIKPDYVSDAIESFCHSHVLKHLLEV